MKKLLRLLLHCRHESGNILAIVAIGMTVLLGFTALVVDVGRVYVEKSTLQKAVDAAVLGGAQVLLTNQSTAKTVAKDIAQSNSYTLADSELTVTSNYIQATKKVSVPMTFAKVLGIDSMDVSATAKAIVGPLKAGSGITPLAIEKSAIPSATQLNCNNTGNNRGNCGYLAIDGNGASDLAAAIINGTKRSIGENVTTKTGQDWGPVKTAFSSLIESDKDKPQCQSAATADNSCKRVIFVVVVDSWEGVAGKSTLPAIGLAAYWLSGVDESTKGINGQFIKMVSPGEIGTTGIGEYNLYGIKLTE